MFPPSRKRIRDVEDDFFFSENTGEKRIRSSVYDTPVATFETSQWRFVQSSPVFPTNTAEQVSSFTSTASLTSGMTEESMDWDPDTPTDTQSIISSQHDTPTSTTAPKSFDPQSSTNISTWPTSIPYTITPSSQSSIEHRLPRRSDSLLIRPTRPRPCPVQTSHIHTRFTQDPSPKVSTGMTRSISLTHRNSPRQNRWSRVIDEEEEEGEDHNYNFEDESALEPFTPTTFTGGQFSLLSVSGDASANNISTFGDMDLDDLPTGIIPSSQIEKEVVVSPHESLFPLSSPRTIIMDNSEYDYNSSASGRVIVRKQRQRSGAFISSPDVAKRFQMGYRDGCEKCRDKVPGHMNHFVDS